MHAVGRPAAAERPGCRIRVGGARGRGHRGPGTRRCAPRARARRNRAPGAQDRRVGPVDVGPPRRRAPRRAPCRGPRRTDRPRSGTQARRRRGDVAANRRGIENDRTVPLASSGPMETAIDLAIARRFTARGMRWFRRGASPLLDVRLLRLNGTWNHSWSRRFAAARRPWPLAAEPSAEGGVLPGTKPTAGCPGPTRAWTSRNRRRRHGAAGRPASAEPPARSAALRGSGSASRFRNRRQ